MRCRARIRMPPMRSNKPHQPRRRRLLRRPAIAPPALTIKIATPIIGAAAATADAMPGVTAAMMRPQARLLRPADRRRAVMIACTILTAIAAIGRTATHANSFIVTETIRAATLRCPKRRGRGPSHSGAAVPSGAAIRTKTDCPSPVSPPRALALLSLLYLPWIARPKLDVLAFRLMAVAIELITHHGDSDRKRANNKIAARTIASTYRRDAGR